METKRNRTEQKLKRTKLNDKKFNISKAEQKVPQPTALNETKFNLTA